MEKFTWKSSSYEKGSGGLTVSEYIPILRSYCNEVIEQCFPRGSFCIFLQSRLVYNWIFILRLACESWTTYKTGFVLRHNSHLRQLHMRRGNLRKCHKSARHQPMCPCPWITSHPERAHSFHTLQCRDIWSHSENKKLTLAAKLK